MFGGLRDLWRKGGRRADTSLPNANYGPARVLLVCSSGGHLAQLMRLEGWWRGHDRMWVTFNLPDARSQLADEPVVWAHHPVTRNFSNAVRNLGLAVKVIRSFKPDIIVSNGAGVAFPFFVFAKLARVKTVYIEVYDRIDSRTLNGRLCQPFTDLFLVQWPEQKELYRRAELVGPLY
ncbi:MAG: UDP-N-acetylglucosamine--LPS N-acetylglucosamine transferase [Actinomycetia bacterium]|nr:UDP-N-acetylglucosamine--LPS N-acetylglucosamine transferase [Actinomycetes bacterium]